MGFLHITEKNNSATIYDQKSEEVGFIVLKQLVKHYKPASDLGLEVQIMLNTCTPLNSQFLSSHSYAI